MAGQILHSQTGESDPGNIIQSLGNQYTNDSVLQAITLFYGTHGQVSSVSGKARRNVSDWLVSFQKSEEAWGIIFDLISGQDLAVEAKLFIAQTFRQKIEYDLNQLDQVRQLALRDKLLELLCHSRTGPKSIITQLCLSLADLAIQFTSWNDPVGFMVQALGSQPETILPLLEFLEVLPEELRYNRALQTDKDKLELLSQKLIKANSHHVVAMVIGYLQTMGTNADVQKRVLSCLESWIHIGNVEFELIEKSSILDIAHSALSVPDLFDHGIDILCEIIRRTGPPPRPATLVDAMYGKLMTLTTLLKENHEDEDMVQGLCRLFVEAGEAYVDVISTSPESFASLLDAIIFCAGHEELDIVKITFHFWYLLAEEITKPELATIKPGFFPLYATLIHHILKHLQYPDDLTTWNAEERDSFREFRHVMGDVLKDCVRVLGDEQALSIPFARLQSFVKTDGTTNSSNIEQWQSIEAPLFSLRAMCREVSTAESRYLPEIMAMLPHLPPHPKIKYATILVIGRYAEWTNNHPQMLSYQMDYVSQGFDNDRDTIAAAAQTFRDLCKYCSKHLVPFLSQLHPFYVTTIGKVSREERLQMTEAVSYVISDVPYQDLKNVLEMYSIPIASRLHESLSFQSTSEEVKSSAIKDAIECVAEFGTLVKYLRPNIPADSTHPGVDILYHLWPLLDKLLDDHGHIPQVSQAMCRLLRNSLQSYKEYMIPTLLPIICEKLVVMFEKTHVPSYLWVVGIVVNLHGSDTKPEGKLVYTLVEKVTGLVFHMVQQPSSSYYDLPDVIFEYYDLLGLFLEKSPITLASSPLVQPTFLCGIHCLALGDSESSRTVLTYFLDLVRVTRPSDTAIAPVLANPSPPLPSEVNVSLVSFITENMEKCISPIFSAAANALESDDRGDGHISGSVLYAFSRIMPAQTIVGYVQRLFETEYAELLTEKLKVHFLENISKNLMAENHIKMETTMSEFAVTCHRRKAVLSRR